jgi:hypothetical protein
MEEGGQRHAPADLPPGKEPDTHYIGGRLGPRAGVGILRSIICRDVDMLKRQLFLTF